MAQLPYSDTFKLRVPFGDEGRGREAGDVSSVMGMDRCVQVCLVKRGCVLYRDCVVLERHHDIAPQVGVSVGIMPNGARILDQLGLFDAVESEIEACEKSFNDYPDGFGFTSAFPSILHEQ